MASADAPRHDRSSNLPAARPPVPPDGPVTVGSLLRREGRAAHAQDRPVVPRARDVADRGPAHRAAVTAGTILAVVAVLGTNVAGDVALGPTSGGDDGERGFGGAVVPESPNPLSRTSMATSVGHAMAVLRAAGSPVLAAMDDLSGGRTAASGAGIVAQALAGAAGPAAAAAVVPAATSTPDETSGPAADDSPADTADGSDARSSTAGSSTTGSSTRRTEADDAGSRIRPRSDRPSPTPRRTGVPGVDTPTLRVPPVLSGRGPAGAGGGVALPTTPVFPARPASPAPAPAGGSTTDPAVGAPTTDAPSEEPTADAPATEAPATGSAAGGTDGAGTADRGSAPTTDADASGSDDSGSGTTSDDATTDSVTTDSVTTDRANSDSATTGGAGSDDAVSDSSASDSSASDDTKSEDTASDSSASDSSASDSSASDDARSDDSGSDAAADSPPA